MARPAGVPYLSGRGVGGSALISGRKSREMYDHTAVKAPRCTKSSVFIKDADVGKLTQIQVKRRITAVMIGLGLILMLAVNTSAVASQPEGFSQLSPVIQSRWNPDDRLLDLSWEDLIPEGFRANAVLDQYDPEMIAQLTDDDPLIIEIMDKLQQAYQSAPVQGALDSLPVRLGGYIAPLEITPEGVTEFLLVPYFGACIHTPPPPSNQIIYVKTAIPVAESLLMDGIWVSGRLSVVAADTDLAMAGYTLYAEHIVPIEY